MLWLPRPLRSVVHRTKFFSQLFAQTQIWYPILWIACYRTVLKTIYCVSTIVKRQVFGVRKRILAVFSRELAESEVRDPTGGSEPPRGTPRANHQGDRKSEAAPNGGPRPIAGAQGRQLRGLLLGVAADSHAQLGDRVACQLHLRSVPACHGPRRCAQLIHAPHA